MYLGLMQRGVEAMILFMAGIVIPVWLQMEALCALIIVPLWFYCFFDSFYQRANLEAGLDVEDRGMINLISWVTDNYYLLGVGLIVLGALGLLNTLGYDLSDSANTIIQEIAGRLQRYLPPLLLIAFGIYLLRRTNRSPAQSHNATSAPSEAILPIPEPAIAGEADSPTIPEVAAEDKAEEPPAVNA